ncbi:hypothetical protein NP233_g12446 [Leucocoprinus birnbaumii]|uniref:Protein kinase domain-containing protein n=1 Tax=Leucocoprinus birnbaumii TaxID=56174 RepID=A0AAD5YQ09_9AGAR|nr:hypothetical protein NP233_g12446 [Leucocoprinus birnbaumii]
MAQSSTYVLDVTAQIIGSQPPEIIAEEHNCCIALYRKHQARRIVKKFRLRRVNHTEARASLESAALGWRTVENHPNVNRLIGLAYWRDDPLPSIVTWYMGPTLMEYLHITPTNEVHKFAMLFGVADALAFMHGHNPPILHTNVKATMRENALLTDISIHEAIIQSNADSSVRWRAPERALNTAPLTHHTYTKECDCWSMGMTIYEVMFQRKPYAEIQDDVQVPIWMNQGHLPSLPQGLSKNFKKLLFGCWVVAPQERFRMGSIANYLRLLGDTARS